MVSSHSNVGYLIPFLPLLHRANKSASSLPSLLLSLTLSLYTSVALSLTFSQLEVTPFFPSTIRFSIAVGYFEFCLYFCTCADLEKEFFFFNFNNDVQLYTRTNNQCSFTKPFLFSLCLVINKGQVLTHYYRLMNKSGGYTWLQTCATVVCNSKNAEEQNIICVNYVIRCV